MVPSIPVTPSGGHPDLPAQSLRIMCATLERLGLAASPLFADSGIDPEVLNAPGARIPAKREFAFQRAFMHATRQTPGAWLETGCQYRLVSFGEFGLAMLAATSMREAVEFAIEHAALAFTQCRFAWAADMPAAHTGLAIVTDDVDADMVEFSIERDLGAIRTMVDDMWQGHFPLSGIELVLRDAGRRARFEHALQTSVYFAAARTVVCFPDELLDRRLPLGDALLGSTYAQRCGQRLRTAEAAAEDTVDVVFALLHGARGSWPDIVTAARRLRLSERSLRRRLSEAGTSFRGLQRQVREQRARDLLQTSGLAVERIAEELGYSEAASFSHAFRHWTGLSPRAFRRDRRRALDVD